MMNDVPRNNEEAQPNNRKLNHLRMNFRFEKIGLSEGMNFRYCNNSKNWDTIMIRVIVVKVE